MDSIPRAVFMPVNDFGQDLIKIGSDETVIVGVLEQGANRLEIPERRIHGVVLWCLARIRKSIWEHASIDELRESEQNALSHIKSSRRQRQSRKRDHRVSSPVTEPMITGNDRLLVSTGNNILVCCRNECADEISVIRECRDYGCTPFD